MLAKIRNSFDLAFNVEEKPIIRNRKNTETI